MGLLSLPLQEPELLLLLRERGAVGIPHTLTGGEVRLEAGRKGRCSFWLVGSCGHLGEHRQAAAAQRGPTLGSPPRGEKQREVGGQNRQCK